MTTIRALEARLRAWTGFRAIARAARTLAAAQSLRWATRVRAAAQSLAWCDALARDLGPPPPGPRVPVLIGLGTDLGLCGRLNRQVADALVAERRARAPALTIAVGQRLLAEVHGTSDLVAFPAPSAAAAAQTLAGRLERLLQALGPPAAIDLTIVLPTRTLTSGTPVIEAWSAAPTDGGDAVVALTGPRLLLTPKAHLVDPVAGLCLHARLVHALCVAQASEAGARLQTMSRAVEQSERRIVEQERQVRKLHQEVTTQEMLEVLGGGRSVIRAWRRPDADRDSSS